MYRCIRKVLKLILCLCMALVLCFLCGCGQGDGDTTATSTPGGLDTPPPEDSQEMPEESAGELSPPPEISFGLEGPGDPIFGDPGLAQDTGSPTGMYTIADDGFAYALDPNTFTPIGPPLDPVTHLPLDVTPEPTIEVSIPPEVTTPPVESEELPIAGDSIEGDTVTATVPPEDKLPNTGIFLEDD